MKSERGPKRVSIGPQNPENLSASPFLAETPALPVSEREMRVDKKNQSVSSRRLDKKLFLISWFLRGKLTGPLHSP